MSQIETLPAPQLPVQPEDKWRREQRAFRRLLPALVKTHLGKYVAIHDEQVVESGTDKLEVARLAYARFGYIPIYVSLVTEAAPSPVRIPFRREIDARIRGFACLPIEVVAHESEPVVLLGRDILNRHNLTLNGPALKLEIES